MKVKKIFLTLFSILSILILSIYWFVPFEEVQFGIDKRPNFDLNNNSTQMQFYKNMRFPSNKITYSIDEDCSIQKRGEMRQAMRELEKLTLLEFSIRESSGEITVSCSEKDKMVEGLFIAGEGGPLNITSGKYFNIIGAGHILLIRDSNCEGPNIAIHELLHVLGFNHSTNINNIMYPLSKCPQTIGEEIPTKINKLYSYKTLPDLELENASAIMVGRYLDVNLSIRNEGLIKAGKSKIVVYIENESVKEFEFKEIDIGHGLNIELKNIWIPKRKIEELKFSIENDFDEITFENNQIVLNKKL